MMAEYSAIGLAKYCAGTILAIIRLAEYWANFTPVVRPHI